MQLKFCKLHRMIQRQTGVKFCIECAWGAVVRVGTLLHVIITACSAFTCLYEVKTNVYDLQVVKAWNMNVTDIFTPTFCSPGQRRNCMLVFE